MVKCPQCKHLHNPRPFCPSCGHEYPKRESVVHVAGTLSELVASGDRKAHTVAIWPQVVGYARKYRDDPARAEKLAKALFFKMTKNWPTVPFDRVTAAPLTPEVANKIRSLNIAYAASRKRMEARA
jgi:hypothetical protein